ncbi:SET domain-containing protein [Biscogniauxia mediterranea]|nr:SET domain-containing protein [Biscogniauxia mediterranea]
MSDPAFDAKSASFLDWFKAWPGATFHPDIRITDLRGRGAGRGIVTTADIPEDTVLFTIPRAAIISTETSDLAKRIPQLFATTGLEDDDNEADEDGSETSGPPDNWVSLILVMIYEYLQGDKSRWRPYFDVLPGEFETLMWWSDRELDQLQASSIVSRVGKDEADGMFRTKVLPVVEQNAGVFYPEGASQRLSEEQLMQLAHRMGSTIMAYAFDLENEDDEDMDAENEDEWMEDREGKTLMGMVPMADILNADAEFNAHVNHGEDSLTVTSLRPIPAGQEILNYYGPLGNGELLRRYGYVTDRHSRYDVVELSWDLILSVLKDSLRLNEAIWGKALNELDPEEIEDAFVIDRDLGEPDSQGLVHGDSTLKHLPEDLREQFNTFLKAIRKFSPETVPDKRKRDEIFFSTVRKALQLRLAEYQTSTAEDMNLLSDDKLSGRQRMAVMVRCGEKMLLEEAILLAGEKLEQLGPTNEDSNHEPSAKRQRTR